MKKRLSIFILVTTAFSLLSGIACAQDTLKRDSVCTTVDQYRLDNIMIVDLLNTRSEQGAVIGLQDKKMLTYKMEIKNWENISSILNDSLIYYKDETIQKNRKLLRTRKIALGGVIIALLFGLLH